MKICSSCKIEKEASSFYANHRVADGLSYSCKGCQALQSKSYRTKNKDKISDNKRKWYDANKLEVLQYQASYYESNKEHIVSRVVQYRKKRLKTDMSFKLQKNLRHRLSKLLRQQSSKIAVEFLGCSLDELKNHLEANFQNGMTWENYGKWHVDHIRPLSSFDLSSPEQLQQACSYVNLQPLWAKDNRSKSNKVE